jgi:hypothetical protein
MAFVKERERGISKCMARCRLGKSEGFGENGMAFVELVYITWPKKEHQIKY